MEFNISKEYTETPGARSRDQGPFSGQQFREDHLEPLYEKVRLTAEIITIILDGAYGYPPSFLEEAFGGLARKYPEDDVFNKFIFISNDQPSLVENIKLYIDNVQRRGQ